MRNLIPLLFALSLCFFAVQSEDIFMYLALARDFFQHGKFAAVDPFIYPLTQTWTILHQWLSYILFYAAFLAGGYNGLIALKCFLILALLALPIRLFKNSHSAQLYWMISVFVGSLAMSFRWIERSSLFAEVVFIVLLYFVRGQLIRRTSVVWAIPSIFILWVNLHPSFPLGWGLLAIAVSVCLVQSRLREAAIWTGVLLTSVLACLVNPRFLDGLLYPLTFAQNEGALFRKLYFEWFPTLDPLFFWHPQSLFIAALIILNLYLLFRARFSRPIFELLTSVYVIVYGLYAIRFVPTMCFALILMNVSLALRSPQVIAVRRWSVVILSAMLILAAKNIFWGHEVLSGSRSFGGGLDQRVVPVQAADVVRKNFFVGNIFNSHVFGGYLAWVWNGERKIFYHGFVTDTEYYMKEYVEFFKGRKQFDAQVAKYDIKVFLLDRFVGGEPILEILSQHPNWVLAFEDETSLVFVPKDSIQVR